MIVLVLLVLLVTLILLLDYSCKHHDRIETVSPYRIEKHFLALFFTEISCVQTRELVPGGIFCVESDFEVQTDEQ